jgi:dihydroorotate dehydrogenase (NAD+) catalytic subunit
MEDAMADDVNMAVTVAGIRMRSPVLVASGTFGYGAEYADLVDLNRLGGIMVKGISAQPWNGNPPPRLVEVPGGLVNAIGLQNPGVEAFVADALPFLRRFDLPVIVNVWGRTVEDYAAVCARLDGVDGIHGLELNISCPNIKQGGIAFGVDPEMTRRVIAAARAATRLPLIPKLAPNVPDIGRVARIAADAGADALSLINTIPAMVIDIETRRPVLANVTGGLSGPAIHPVAVKLVWDAARAVSLPIIAMGGITDARDAIEFLLAGATAVAVGTASFMHPDTALRVETGIEDYLRRHGLRAVGDMVGAAA